MTPLFYPSLHGKPRKAAEKNAHPLSLIDPREYFSRKLYHNTELDVLPVYLTCRSIITRSQLIPPVVLFARPDTAREELVNLVD